MDPFSMLELLLSENQFELILPETGTSAPDTIRLVYLMNDAVESFPSLPQRPPDRYLRSGIRGRTRCPLNPG